MSVLEALSSSLQSYSLHSKTLRSFGLDFCVDFMGKVAGLVNTVMKLQGPLGAGIYVIAERLLASK
jgi:hypothetical protein